MSDPMSTLEARIAEVLAPLLYGEGRLQWERKWAEAGPLVKSAWNVLAKEYAAALAAADKAATITTFTGLDSLPDGSVIIDKHGDVSQRRGDWWCGHETANLPSRQIAKYLPARVIHWGTE